MAALPPLAHASPTASEDREHHPPAPEGASGAPLAWLEIESLTFSEFKQGESVRSPFNLRFKNKAVSLVHCEIYSVLFDKDERYPPLIYVRDCQSTSGTYVNSQLVGEQPFVTAARLLENNDTISVGPCTLRLCDYIVPSAESALSASQREEASLFSDQFVIKDIILGDGSFANVHLAVDVKTNQQLVCKVHDLSSLRSRHDSIVQRVDREMSIWSQLDHPNIVAFHRAFRTSNTMFTFGDLATGGDLFSLLERERSIPELEIKWIVRQVLRAVDYLHCKGVAHRDIKPENILCSSSFHMHHRIVLADFGCAGVASLGRMTSNVGTDIYRAPEAQLPEKPHGIAVDIWSIGVLVLQLLAGDEPVESLGQSGNGLDIDDLVAFVNFRRAGQENGPISQHGVDFILACLNPKPYSRPTAAKAAQHMWLRESAQEVALFKEREKQLTWKPRGIIIPAIVRLENNLPSSVTSKLPSEDGEPPNGKRLFAGLPAPPTVQEVRKDRLPEGEALSDLVQISQSTDDTHQRKKTRPDRRSDTVVAAKQSLLMINYRSNSIS